MEINTEELPPTTPEMEKYLNASKIIDSRVQECGLRGHAQPSEAENRCNHCFQHLVYPTPETDEILKRNHNLSQPYDAQIILEARQIEIRKQKYYDRLAGIEKLMGI
jgi:hypothetical protein